MEIVFLCKSIVGNMRSGPYSAPEGATVRDMLALCEEENGITINPDYYKWLAFLADGQHAGWETVLDGVEKLHVLSVAFGG